MPEALIRNPRGRDLLLILGGVLPGLVFALFLVFHAHGVNGRNGFPLDDPWIHLTYARTLHDAHSFSYFPGETRSQGSTAPLYTLLLALGFGATRDEKVLSYLLGLLFHTGFLVCFALWAREALRRVLGDDRRVLVTSILAAVLLGLDSRIGILSVSGMETSLFLFLLALTVWAERRGALRAAGIAAGLLVWVRPDGLILIAVLLINRLAERLRPAGGSRAQGRAEARARDAAALTPESSDGARWGGAAALAPESPDRARSGAIAALLPARLLVPAGLLVLGYFVFNLVTGGAVLPNTFAAKAAYYRQNSREFFVFQEVREVFLTGAWVVVTPLAFVGLVATLARWYRRRASPLRLEAGWSLALPLAYYVFLPFAHRFGRYLIPALPAVMLLGCYGLWIVAGAVEKLLSRPAEKAPPRRSSSRPRRPGPASGFLISGLVFLAALVLTLRAAAAGTRLYTEHCAYHYTRHERTGLWLAENTPPGAVIATHDVGAIAFYSRRKVVDMVGLVQPEVVPHIGKPDYLPFLQGLFTREKVTYLAVLRNWCEVVNVEPLFTADPRPEVMEVFPWVPGRTHLMPRQASELNRLAADRLRASDAAGALTILQSSLTLDPESSRTWLLAGAAGEVSGQPAEAERSYREVLRLYPESPEGALRLAVVLSRQGRKEEALPLVRALVERKPDFPGAASLLRSLSTGAAAR